MKYIIGVDLGGTTVSIGLFNSDLKLINSIVLSTEAHKGVDYILSKISSSVLNLIKSRKISKKDVLGIGFGSPGPLDTKKGIIHFCPNLKGWKNVPLVKIVSSKTGISTYLENDANAAAYGEWRMGSGKGVCNMLFATLGTGIGGGLILNGELYHGKDDAAGELGHVILFPDGIKCGCGSKGCIEMYASATGIVRRAKEALNTSTILTSKDVYLAALKKNKIALNIMEETGRFLGIVFSSIINLLNLDMIVIGGNVSNAGEMLLKPIRKEIIRTAMYPAKNIKVIKAKLGPNAGMIGAACLVLDRINK
ncbi:MAG: hypothetical protein A2252_03670 [Elusimicrobia bacterium RIFOXYA2_FULL_39_19]|nr:MAG: hypothetical protein A2252_03670 [Elusimicrobia bacterium RIFOXYA2_FULL_39_19]